MTPEPGLMVGSKYKLVRPLGEGGMGAVWVARHTQLDVDVAVKLMNPELAGTPSAVARFEREAKAAAQLKSPHVVHIHDYGVEDGYPYIVMELIEGEDLDALLTRERSLSLVRAAEILGQTAKALRAAHDAGIVHRDLKPSNLFLARPGGDLLVKVLDFGIAKETHSMPVVNERTTTGVVLGSPLYMSPEQARGGAVGPASDLWSIAVVVFEMITGIHPFLGATVGDVIAKICGDELPVPSRFDPTLPPELDAFFQRALMRNPARRFGSARELSDAFAAIAVAHPEAGPQPRAKPEDGPSRHADTIEVVDTAEPQRLGRTGATAPLVIPVTTGALVDEATAPAEPSAVDKSAALRATVPAPEPPPPVKERVTRRVAIGVFAVVMVAMAYFLAARPSGPAEGAGPEAPTAVATAPTPTTTPTTAAPTAVTPTVTASTALPTTASAQASPEPPPPPPTTTTTPTARPSPAPRPSASPRPRATATARPSAPRIDPFTGLPVRD